ncbi:MAG TPA: tetratricopeptide repeat protein [Terriglobia bacterium]|nr:tetratricopeptide repeat protein [Terriglobia bacterium]
MSGRFDSQEVQRILGLTRKQLDSWDRQGLVSPRKEGRTRFYDFKDLIGLRTVKQLVETGVPANRLRRALLALRKNLSGAGNSLAELRILSDGKDVIVESAGSRLEPLSGQFVLNFETREIGERVHVLTGDRPEEWIARASQYETDARTRTQAIDAYQHVLAVDPDRIDALINCGILYYEDGSLEKALEYFRRALAFDAENALIHFNLGSVLEETGDLEAARQHLRQAVRLHPGYADAHYNLAFVCDKMSAYTEARQHWQTYVQLDPLSPWCHYARGRLACFQATKSVASP